MPKNSQEPLHRLHNVLSQVLPTYQKILARQKIAPMYTKYKNELIKRVGKSHARALHHRIMAIRFSRIGSRRRVGPKISEGLLDLFKKSHKSVATIKAKHHDRIADRLSNSTDEKKFHRHDRAARRYQRVADGKKPFGENQE